MLKRLVWLVIGMSLGFGISFWILRTVRQTVDRFTPDAARAVRRELKAALTEGRQGMREREAELRSALPPVSSPVFSR